MASGGQKKRSNKNPKSFGHSSVACDTSSRPSKIGTTQWSKNNRLSCHQAESNHQSLSPSYTVSPHSATIPKYENVVPPSSQSSKNLNCSETKSLFVVGRGPRMVSPNNLKPQLYKSELCHVSF